MQKILHIGGANKFLYDYIYFINNNFNIKNHYFFLKSINKEYKKNINFKVSFINNYIKFIFVLNKSNKIILHSFPDIYISFILILQPWLLKKCYWVIWGGDLYAYKYRKINLKSNIYEFIRKIIIKRIGNFITYVEGDYELAKKWYGASGKYHECIMYESNLYKEVNVNDLESGVTKILIGNSSTETNNHIEVFEKLSKFKLINVKIIVPLTYGNEKYKEYIIKEGEKFFSKKFFPLINYMDSNNYLKMLNEIDIAIFNHKRQQGMGNTISLLGMGKKVFIRRGSVQWDFFKKLGLKIYDTSSELKKLKENFGKKEKMSNISIIKDYFSRENLIFHWDNIFNNK